MEELSVGVICKFASDEIQIEEKPSLPPPHTWRMIPIGLYSYQFQFEKTDKQTIPKNPFTKRANM